jgi:hypothetical protein
MRILYTYLCCFVVFLMSAQEFQTDTIVYNGPSSKRINLVFLSDGYTVEQLVQYCKDVEIFNRELFSQVPFSNYKDYFNVFAIRVPSNEEGADHPGTATDVTEPKFPVTDVDTYFDSEFDYLKIHRLLVSLNSAKINSVLASNFPAYDQAFVLVNSPNYGGSGGAIPVSSTNGSAAEVVIHELGHSFARLSDEYYAGDIYAGESINMTQIQDAEKVKWKNWHGDEGIGIYQHCCGNDSEKWYKPHENCKMRALGLPFCAVCREAIIERIHSFVSPIISYEPEETKIAPETFPLKFQIATVDPNPNTLSKKWKLNDKLVASNQNSFVIESVMLENDMNLLVMTLEDTTEMLRITNHSERHSEVILWEIDNLTTGTIGVQGRSVLIDVFPNPTTELISIETKSGINSDVDIRIYNMEGRELISSMKGFLNQRLDIDVSMLSSGLYVMNIILEDGVIYSEKIVIQ